ncbi:hypothetical protein BDB01DRAFT_806164 [Pilobolus umbonatus]|nr:hypothetical protein BDB01DRAFT_806164 [Pilobolus umbonatus]
MSSNVDNEEKTIVKAESIKEEEEDEELDEFGRVKRRREKFKSERSDDNKDRSDSDDNSDRYYHRRSRRRSSSPSRRYRRRHYSDSESDSERRYKHSYRRHHDRHRSGDPYSDAAQYIDTEFYPTKVYIGDIENVSVDQIKSIFSKFGPLEDVKLVEGKDYGFITFEQKEAALNAIQSMHGALLGTKRIKVNRAKIPERNKVGFGNIPWQDEDGLMAKETYFPLHGKLSFKGLDTNDPIDLNPVPRRALTSYDDL